MSTEGIRNSVVGNSTAGVPEPYGLQDHIHHQLHMHHQQLVQESPKRKHEHLEQLVDEDERVAKRMRVVEAPEPLVLNPNEHLHIPEANHHLPPPLVAALTQDQRWLPPTGFLPYPDFMQAQPQPMQTTPWIPTPTTAVPLPNAWGAEGYYPSFSILPGWGDGALTSNLSHQLYQRQLQNTIQSLSPGASIAPLLAPVMPDDINTPKKSPLLEPENHKFYDHPALLQKLSLSKSPVLEAVIYCALNKWGIEMLPFGPDKKLSFKVTDFDKFSVYSAKINSKGKPTTDVSSRVKALRRWFDGIPKVKDRKIAFVMSVKGSEDKNVKVTQLVDKVTAVYTARLAAVRNPESLGVQE